MNPTKDIWVDTLQKLYSNYNVEYFSLFGFPDIRAELMSLQDFERQHPDAGINNHYVVFLVQKDESGEEISHILSNKYEDLIGKTENLLKSWKNVYRHSYNSWIFESKETAAQYITVFNLWKK